MTDPSSLAGRTVLVTRPPDRARSWTAVLEARGARVLAREVFRLESMAGEARAQRVIDSIDRFDWILVTSSNGLRFFVRALRTRGIEPAAVDASYGAVGPQTAGALAELDVDAVVVGDPPNAEGLAAALVGRIAPEQRVLIVRPERSRPELEQALATRGLKVDAVPFYRNRPSSSVDAVAAELETQKIDAVIFSSPSAVEYLDAACRSRRGAGADIFGSFAAVAIGPTTAHALCEHGHEVDATAREPTPEGLADAVHAALER